MRVPYRMACEFCEMVSPCGNGPARMGALASVSSPMENQEIYQMVASFSQDNQMENEVWLGWNSQNPRFWEDGTPAYPNGFAAFTSQGAIPPRRPGMPGRPTSGWPVSPANPFTPPPGRAPVMKRQRVNMQPGQGGALGPEWDLVEATAMRAFVCEVAAGQNIPPGQQPGFGGQQPGFGGGRQQPGFGGGRQQPGFGGGRQQPGFGGGRQQPGFGGQQPGFGGQQPGFGGGRQQPGFGGGQQPGFGGQQPGFGGQQPGFGGRQQPGFGGQQPGMGGQQPGMGGQQPNSPNPRFNRPRMLQETVAETAAETAAEADVTA